MLHYFTPSTCSNTVLDAADTALSAQCAKQQAIPHPQTKCFPVTLAVNTIATQPVNSLSPPVHRDRPPSLPDEVRAGRYKPAISASQASPSLVSLSSPRFRHQSANKADTWFVRHPYYSKHNPSKDLTSHKVLFPFALNSTESHAGYWRQAQSISAPSTPVPQRVLQSIQGTAGHAVRAVSARIPDGCSPAAPTAHFSHNQGRPPIPVKRLYTLQRNAVWRPLIDRWCLFRLAESSFNILRWEWMAVSCVDDFWIPWIEETMMFIRAVQASCCPEFNPTQEAWEWLRQVTQGLPSRSSKEPDVAANIGTADASRHRQVLQYCVSEAAYLMPDINHCLNEKKHNVDVLSKVMHHISFWAVSSSNNSQETALLTPTYRQRLVLLLTAVIIQLRNNPSQGPPTLSAFCNKLGLLLEGSPTAGDVIRGCKTPSCSYPHAIPLQYYQTLLQQPAHQPNNRLAEVLSIEFQNDVWRTVSSSMSQWRTPEMQKTLLSIARVRSPEYMARFQPDSPWAQVCNVVRRWFSNQSQLVSFALRKVDEEDKEIAGPALLPLTPLWKSIVLRRIMRIRPEYWPPYNQVPPFVIAGFTALENRSLKNDKFDKTAAHFHLARSVLDDLIAARPKVAEILLLTALVFGHATCTPFVRPGLATFEPTIKAPRSGCERTAALLTRIL
ncbi:hypothetical protein CH63R_01774 [Colletotrichum higginsianum IMI 349063]|uniref:Uncharacterized protein n=1 Tax=Colletotrichum higginsianum (strain IMI 349063) TaxID=759273 RepID=A0A1B7YXB7_COLHI|nr:hypothetical protein CH63R_01774 [Colletotrichum higginsianum IMI 349063]OBR16594.1 hypothetical protein CH63R_01774 [Colletotrichum higginsianum IMI 349063]